LAMNAILSRAELRDEAETLMTRAVKTFPNSRRVRYRLAELYRDSGRMKQALEVFKQASELQAPPGFDPSLDRRQRSFVFQRIGGINTDLVRFDDAVTAYEKALDINPDNADARLALGDAYLQRNRLDEALAEYTRVITANPRFAAAHNRLAELHLRMGHFSESAALAAKALEIDPAHRRSRYVRGIALIRMGRNEEGEKELKEYEKLENEAQAETNGFREIAVINRGAAALLKDGRAEDAIAMLRQGVESHPEATTIYLNLATALSKLGRHREAVQTLEVLVDRGLDNNVMVHRNFAREYQALGDTKASIRHEVRYLQLMDATLEAVLD
jgi:tetratricopeptide (TPR) repeat protein